MVRGRKVGVQPEIGVPGDSQYRDEFGYRSRRRRGRVHGSTALSCQRAELSGRGPGKLKGQVTQKSSEKGGPHTLACHEALVLPWAWLTFICSASAIQAPLALLPRTCRRVALWLDEPHEPAESFVRSPHPSVYLLVTLSLHMLPNPGPVMHTSAYLRVGRMLSRFLKITRLRVAQHAQLAAGGISFQPMCTSRPRPHK